MKLSPPTRPSEPLLEENSSRRRLPAAAERGRRRTRRRLGIGQWFMLLVMLPTLVVGAYYVGYAADIYESEARFVLRSRGGGSSSGGGSDSGGGGRIAGAASLFAASMPGTQESRAVVSFVDSHAIVEQIQREVDLVGIWRRPEADLIAKLWWEQPQLEWLLWYFRRRVRTEFDMETGVMTVRSHAFRPDDAKLLSEQVLKLSENLVNQLSARSIADTLRVAQEDVGKAEARVIAAREALIAFREREQAFDPTRSASGAVDNIGRLESALAQARADLQERRSFMRPDNPQIQVLQNRISALQTQIGAERGRVTRGEEALPQQVAGYERLELERAFADRQLASATASLEAARSDVLRQQVFLARIADPSDPQWASYPKAAFNTLTVFVSLSVLFGIGWLLVVSAREHAS